MAAMRLLGLSTICAPRPAVSEHRPFVRDTWRQTSGDLRGERDAATTDDPVRGRAGDDLGRYRDLFGVDASRLILSDEDDGTLRNGRIVGGGLMRRRTAP